MGNGKKGSRIFPIEELKANLRINENEYTRYSNFKNRALESYKEKLEIHTQMQFLLLVRILN